MSEHRGKIVLITGGNRGLGLATAHAFVRAGATVFVSGRSARASDDAARSLHGEGEAFGLQLDVTDHRSVEAAVEAVERRTGQLDIVVNNAAFVGPLAPLSNVDAAAWRAGIETNVVGPFNVARATLRLLLATRGAIVNVSAGAADTPLEGMSAYCCSKAGLAMLTRSLALEFGASGLRVFGFRPGMLDTDMQTQIRESHVNRVSLVDRQRLNPPFVAAQALLGLCGKKGLPLAGTEVVWNDPRLG